MNTIDKMSAAAPVSPGALNEAPRQENTRPDSAAGRHRPDAAPRRDRVDLSPAARELQRARAELDALPDVQVDKVAEIKRRLAEDTYRMDSARIARRMLDDTLVE